MDAKWAVVFAQLIIKGKGYGVHGFLTRIRDEVRLLYAQPALA